jgi:hypothetical protein
MRIAVCLSGLYRTFNECYPTLVENLIKCNPEYTFDIISFFSKKEEENINLSEYNFIKYEIQSDPPLPNIEYQFNKYMYETHVCTNNYYQLWGLKQVNRLRLETLKKYDIIARIRTDFKFLSPVLLKNTTWDKIYIPQGHDHRGGINDRFAIGPENMMNLYLNRYDFWMEKQEHINNYSTHAELNLKIYLEYLGIPVGRIPFSYCLRRPNEDLGTIII